MSLLIALTWSAIFFLLHPSISTFIRGKIGKSILYGIIMWTMMNLVVLPLSAVDQGSFTPGKVLTGSIILVVAAGLPITYRFDRYYAPKAP